MKKKTNKILSLILAAALAVSSVTFVSYADDSDTETAVELEAAASDSALEVEAEEEQAAVDLSAETEEIVEADLDPYYSDQNFSYTDDFSKMNQEYNMTQYINLAHTDEVNGNSTTKIELQNKAVYATLEDAVSGTGTATFTADLYSNDVDGDYAGRAFRIYLENKQTETTNGVGNAAFETANIFYHLTDIGSTVYVVTDDNSSVNAAGSGMFALGTFETGVWYRFVIEVDFDNSYTTTYMYKHSSSGAYNDDLSSMELVGSLTADTVSGKTVSLKQMRLVRTAKTTVYFDNVSLSYDSTGNEEASTEATTEATTEGSGGSSSGDEEETGSSFLWWFDEVNNGGTVEPGSYTAGNGAADITVVPGLAGESYSKYEAAALEYSDGTTHYGYWASNRPDSAGSLTTLPASGSSYYFKLNTAGTVTVYNYVPSGKNFFVKDFDESLALVNTTTTGSMDSNGNDSLTFAGEAGHTYLVTTGGTNGLRFYGFKFLVDEPTEVPVSVAVGEGVDFSKATISFTDVDTETVYATVVDGQTSITLNAGHTYEISIDDGGIAVDYNGETEFTFTGSEASIDLTLTNVPDVTLTGTITSADSDNAASVVTNITFTKMSDDTVSYSTETAGSIDASAGTYEITLKPGEYNTSVVTTDGSTTYDRVSVAAEGDNVNEIYLEFEDTSVLTMYDEIQKDSSVVTFNGFSAHSAQYGVSGKVGSSITVPASAGQTLNITMSYDGEFNVYDNGTGEVVNTGTSLKATYEVSDTATAVTIEVTATGNVVSGSSGAYVVSVEYIEAATEFKSALSVPGDYDTLNEAIAAIKSMDRPEGEDGRVTITLTSDLQEQVYMDADYVTLDGQGQYEVTWYYGVGSAYYSVDSSGLYSESLFRDAYSTRDASGSLWGGVMLVYGDYFLAHDVTFRNTYNYEVTDKEIADGVTPTDGKKERTKDTDVTVSSMRERSNALYTYGNYCEYKNCNILSSQDTLGINGTLYNYTYFKDCVIGGNCDYICGAGTMLFDNCTLQWKTEGASSLGYITAPKVNPYIFRNCTITQDGSNYVADSTGFYGRPWDAAAYAIYYQCETNDLIRYDGWYDMSSNSADNAYFYEYNNLASDGSVFMSTRGKDLNDEAYADILAAVEGDAVIDGMLGGWTPVYYDSSSSDDDDDDDDGSRGDVDQNGVITANDAACLLAYVLNNETLNPNWDVSAAVADVAGDVDGEILADDVAAILAKVLDSSYKFKKLSSSGSSEETTAEETTEETSEETTEAESEETTEGSDVPFSFVADRDASSSGYAAGDTVYSDDYISVAALQALTIEESEFTIGDYTYSTSVKSSGVNTSVSVDGASASNWRIHSSITALQDCKVTVATKNPGGKIYAFATLNEDGSYTSVAYYDASNTETEGIEVVLNLTAGDVIYVLGSATNPEIYAINVEEAEEAGNPYSFVADRDASSNGYAAGDTIYSDDYITVAALQALTIETSEFTIGNYTYSTAVKSSGVNSSITVDGASAANWRIHSSITALQDCTVTIATKNPGGKVYSFATLNEDGTYTSVLSYDASNSETEGVEASINLTAGDVVYVLGNATNPEIYAINVDDGSGTSSGGDEEEVDVTDDYIVTLADDGLSFSYSYEDSVTTVEIDDSNIYVDGRLTDEEAAQYSNVYNSFTTAMENIKDGTEDSPMNVYIAPYVYWLNDPASESTEDAFGLVLSCANLHLIGLAKHAQNVVIAGNYGHDEGYYNGNWTMFYISGDGLNVSNLTIGNYCNVDLVYPLDTSLNVSKRSSSITQAQIGSYDGDKLYCSNVRFISRLNMMPFVSSQRALYVDCHMESTDDSLNGSYQAVYIGCDFEFHSSKPWYSSGGVTLLDCTMKIVPTNVGTYLKQYLAKDVTSGGRFNTIDCTFTSDYPSVPARIGYSEVLSDSYRSYYSNVSYFGTPVTFDYDGEYPDAGVDITGTDFLKAYKVTDESGNVYYNAYNLLRGTDDWDPLGQKSIITSLGCEDIATTLSAWATADTIESGNSDATISWSIAGPQASTDYLTGYSVTYTVDEEDAEYVTLTPSEDGSTCLVEGTNLGEESRTVVVEVVGSDGNVAAVAFTVTPLILEAPTVTEAPAIVQNSDGTATVSYELALDGREDESRIIWYVSPTGTLDDAIQVAYGRDDEPLTTIDLNQSYIGKYLLLTLEPKNIRSDYGDAVTAVSDVITADGIEAMTEYNVDITNFSTARKNDVLNGFWTIDGYKPSDVDDPDSQFYASWTARTEEEVYDYGVGTSSGFKGYSGLYQLQRGTRLMYTPEGSSYGDMDTTLTLVPGKTASQGFGSANQYIDILVKLDTTNMTGYGLRIYRKTGTSCAFYLVSYDNGAITALTDEIEAVCYAYEVTVHVWTENGVLYATCDSDHDFSTSDSGLATSVSLSAEVADNGCGGTAIIHTGTTGTAYANTTYIVADTIKWETK